MKVLATDRAGRPLKVALRCPAKLNLCLSVAAPEPRLDLHPLASGMVALSFGDDLVVTRRDDGSTKLTRGWADDAPVPASIGWSRRDDLCWRAAEAFQTAAGGSAGVDLKLSKRVPVGGGLGGGSADAAGVLLAMEFLHRDRVGKKKLDQIAARLGSDVAFALRALSGETLAAVSGFGESVQSLKPPHAPLHAALVFPRFGCPTGPVFAALDARLAAGEEPGGLDAEELHRAAEAGWAALAAPGNNLTGPACDVRPELGGVLASLRDAGLTPRVSGSGSTVWILADDAAGATVAAARATAASGLPSLPVSSAAR